MMYVYVGHFFSPIGPCTLWCQVHPIYTIVVVIHDFGQTEVGDFDFPTGCAIHQQDVALKSKEKGSALEKRKHLDGFSPLDNQ